MIGATPITEAGWSDQQRAMFQAQMSAWQKDEVVGVLLALFLGTFGAHHFYLRRTGLGIVYALLFWTGLPTVISLVECFFMPGRVRQYNLALATYFSGQLATVPGMSTVPVQQEVFPPQSGYASVPQVFSRNCEVCGAPLAPEASFCARCGTKTPA